MEILELKDFCRKNKLDEKLFIISSRSIGRQMINKMARNGFPSINLRSVTLKRLAFEILEKDIIEKETLIVDDILGNSLIIAILKDLAISYNDSFFKPGLINSKTAEEVYKTIIELKYSGLGAFPTMKDLDKIYSKYEEKLKSLNAMDHPDIIRVATKSSNVIEYQDKKIGISSNIEFNNLEKKFFEKLIEKDYSIIQMPVKSLENHPKSYYFKESIYDMGLMNKDIRFYNSYGTTDEINFIIEDIKRKRTPFDEVVIAYTNSKYIDLINVEFEKEYLPITFGSGLGVEYSSVFRFINTIFSWATNYYNVNEIKPIFANGDLNIAINEQSTSAASLYEELVLCKIFSLKGNYDRVLGLNEKENHSIENDTNLNKYQKRKRIWLKSFFNDLFSALPEEEYVTFNEYTLKLQDLIIKHVKTSNKYDVAARQSVLQTLDKIHNLDINLTRNEYFDLIPTYIKKDKIFRSQPQPGHVYTTNINSAGYTGRKNLYLIGLDSDSFSNKIVESPILLDFMRTQISYGLSLANESYEYKKYKVKELLTSNFNNISIGYSNFDTVDVKAKSPSQIYIELKDLIGKNDYEDVFTEGRILTGRDLVRSATSLETLAECPRKFYLKYKMNLRAKEDSEIRLDRWVDSRTKGNIVHEVLSLYFDLPEEEQNKEVLEKLVEVECIQAESEVVCLVPSVYLMEKENLVEICEKIIDITKNDKEWKILVNELSFGDSDMKDNKIFGPLPKQTIDVLGLKLDLSGAIDRVDVGIKDDNIFRIVDYKTGDRSKFNKRLRKTIGHWSKGDYDYTKTEKLQYYIYKKALEKILEGKKELYSEPWIEKFTYVFEGHKNNGTIELPFNEEFVNTIEERIGNILDEDLLVAVNERVYDPKNESSCEYCDYSPICIVDKDLYVVEEEEINE